jgi:NADPH-dependent glutamate synthase beta subunit-like oxidoreductase
MLEKIDINKCTGCGECVRLCPLDAVRLDTKNDEIPPCQAGCPAGIDMRGYNYLLKMGKYQDALRLIREEMPLPGITGHVCFHPCETQCMRKDVDKAVNINSLERFAVDCIPDEKAQNIVRQHIAKVAVIGSGPAGLSCAYFLARKGYPVTIFESMPKLGGMLRYGIPEYRLPRKILDSQIKYIENMGVNFQTNISIGKDLTIDELRNNKYKAIFLATGAQLSKKINIKGNDLKGVLWGLDFIRSANQKQALLRGNVVVIGGGNVAMDAALCALRVGASKVEIVCLESKDNIPAHEDSLRQALEEGISINYSWGPKRVLGERGKVTGIELKSCEKVFDMDGRFNPTFNDQILKVIRSDNVIFAIGQSCDLSLLADVLKTPNGTLKVDNASLYSEIPGVFAGGDAVSGPSSVVEAIASGKKAAVSIDGFLRFNKLDIELGTETKTYQNTSVTNVIKKDRLESLYLPLNERQSFKEIKTGFTPDIALKELDRCMTCGSKARFAYPEDCMTCFTCELNCPYDAIYVHPFKEVLPCAK